MAPSLPFVFGSQKDIRNSAGRSGWITQDTSLNSQYKQNSITNLTFRSTIEPIKQFRIELNASKNTSSNNQAMAQLPKFIAELVAIGSVLFLIIYLLILNDSGLNKLLPTLAVFGIAGFKILPAFQQIFASTATIKGNISAFNSIKQELSIAKKHNTESSKIVKVTFEDYIKIDNLSYQYDSKKSFALKTMILEDDTQLYTSVSLDDDTFNSQEMSHNYTF